MTDNPLLKDINDTILKYIEYGQSELSHSRGAYAGAKSVLHGSINRHTSKIAKRGDIIIEINVSVKCYDAPKEEI